MLLRDNELDHGQPCVAAPATINTGAPSSISSAVGSWIAGRCQTNVRGVMSELGELIPMLDTGDQRFWVEQFLYMLVVTIKNFKIMI